MNIDATAGQTRFEVVSPTGQRYPGNNASQVSVTPGAVPGIFSFTFVVSNPGEGWQFDTYAELSSETRVGQAVTVSLLGHVGGIGLGQVSSVGINGAPDFVGGTLQMTFGSGTVTGEVVPPGAPRWTFSGINIIECVVPSSALPPIPGTSPGNWVVDYKLETPQCQPYRPFAGQYQPITTN
jgi:hypothetical protein